jgi:hypothetical protein
MKKAFAFFLLLFFLTAAQLKAAPFETRSSAKIEHISASLFNSNGGLSDCKTSAQIELGAGFSKIDANLIMSARYDSVLHYQTGFEIEEALVRLNLKSKTFGYFTAAAGRQLFSWGAADGIIITDIFCPQDFTSYAGLDFRNSRKAVDAIRASLGKETFEAQFVWVPVFLPAGAALNEKDNPFRRALISQIGNVGSFKIPVYLDEYNTPFSLDCAQYGLRFSMRNNVADFSFCGFYGLNNAPSFIKNILLTQEPGVYVSQKYGRIFMLGTDASVPSGNFVFRFESAYIWGGLFDIKNDLIEEALVKGSRHAVIFPVEKQNLKILLGADRTFSGWTFSAQYIEDIITQSANEIERKARKTAATLSVSKNFFAETLLIKTACYVGLSYFDAVISASAQYVFTDDFSVSIGTDFFDGGIENKGDYAAYKELNCIWFKAAFNL